MRKRWKQIKPFKNRFRKVSRKLVQKAMLHWALENKQWPLLPITALYLQSSFPEISTDTEEPVVHQAPTALAKEYQSQSLVPLTTPVLSPATTRDAYLMAYTYAHLQNYLLSCVTFQTKNSKFIWELKSLKVKLKHKRVKKSG